MEAQEVKVKKKKKVTVCSVLTSTVTKKTDGQTDYCQN